MKIEAIEDGTTERISTGLNSIGGYASHSAQRGREHFAVTLFWIWVVSLSVIALVFGLITAPAALVSDAPSSSLAAWLGLFGATGYTAWMGLTARNRDSNHNPDESHVSRLLERATTVVLSVIERLIGGVTAAISGASIKQRAVVGVGVWIFTYIALSILIMVVLLPASLVASVSAFAVSGGFLGSIGLTAWIWRQSQSEAQTARQHHQQNRPHQQTEPNANRSADNNPGQRQQQQQPQNRHVQPPPDRNFSDVAGMEELKATLREQIIEPFGGSAVYEKYGVSPDSGILFHGPPGTGKTYISKALAGEIGINFISVDVGDIESRWLGEGVENIKRTFAEAHRNQPCFIFIDEIDALATDRSSSDQHEDKKKMVNQLLQELSNIEADDDVLVIGATNTPDNIDDAMLRTGRFDNKIHIPEPDEDARLSIFAHHMTAPTEDIDNQEFLRATKGMVASDMEVIARRASLKAASRERDTGRANNVTEADILDAAEEVAGQQSNIGDYIQRPPDLDFSAVAGMNDLKAELQSKIIDPLADPEFHEEYGLGVENGILLYGPPGTGKTYISKALAGEIGVNYIEAKAGDLVSKWIGQGAENVQQMFEEARSNQPCLIFIDEIDALATDRGDRQTKSERQMVNQFLEELTQLSDDGADVVVIGATNRPDDIDSAMLRTGRFSEKIEVPAPTADARIAVFTAHLAAPTDGIEPQEIAEQTEGFVASDMKNVAERAARTAMQRAKTGGAKEVTQTDVNQAVSAIREQKAGS